MTGPIIATTGGADGGLRAGGFPPGVTGQHNQFALTIAISVALSAFNSLTHQPRLCAVFLRHLPPSEFSASGFNAAFHQQRQRLRPRHQMGDRLALDGDGVFVLGLGLTYGIHSRIPTTFLPVGDPGYFSAMMQLPDGAAIERTGAVASRCATFSRDERPAYRDVVSVSGKPWPGPRSRTPGQFAVLKPWEQREGRGRLQHRERGAARNCWASPRRSPSASTAFDSWPHAGGFQYQLEDLSGAAARTSIS